MKLTIEENRETIKRYRRIRPAPPGSVLCSARCPGSLRSCTQRRGHTGPHVAHGTLKRVVAVWDKGIGVGEAEALQTKAVEVPARVGLLNGGLVVALEDLRDRILRRAHNLDEGLFLVLALCLAGYFVAMILGLVPWH